MIEWRARGALLDPADVQGGGSEVHLIWSMAVGSGALRGLRTEQETGGKYSIRIFGSNDA